MGATSSKHAVTFVISPWQRIFPYLISMIWSYAANAPIFVGQGALPEL
jgi:hypothetical protein